MARWIWLVFVAQAVCGGASAQLLHELAGKDLVWRVKPNGEDMAAAYPQKAQLAEQAGWVILECLTATTGEMKDCKVLGEAPANYGFGAAGLKLSSRFRIDVRKTDPTILEGGVVTIPIIMQTPHGAPLPLRDYRAGQPASLLTVAPNGVGGIACATPSAPDQKMPDASVRMDEEPFPQRKRVAHSRSRRGAARHGLTLHDKRRSEIDPVQSARRAQRLSSSGYDRPDRPVYGPGRSQRQDSHGWKSSAYPL